MADTPSPTSVDRPVDRPGDPRADDDRVLTAAEHDAAVAGLDYEQARDELVRVVGELEQGATSLERSLALWERGEALARRCEQWLLGAKERLDAARTAAENA